MEWIRRRRSEPKLGSSPRPFLPKPRSLTRQARLGFTWTSAPAPDPVHLRSALGRRREKAKERERGERGRVRQLRPPSAAPGSSWRRPRPPAPPSSPGSTSARARTFIVAGRTPARPTARHAAPFGLFLPTPSRFLPRPAPDQSAESERRRLRPR